MVALDRTNVVPFLTAHDADQQTEAALAAHRKVLEGTGAGADMLGWRTMLLERDQALESRVLDVAAEIREEADVLLCIGIGGSYLGARAVMQATAPPFGRPAGPEVIFAGHHLSPRYHEALLEALAGRRVYVNVISKSGTTLEPALALRLVRQALGSHLPSSRVIATTDARRGVLHDMARDEGYRTFEVPDDVGGRFSVLTPVGLLPIAVAGVDIRRLMVGAASAADGATRADATHPAVAYAADRHSLHDAGFTTEVLAVLDPALAGFAAWWQQLFGESEGKQGVGLFPVPALYTSDLHSLGQYMQEGRRNLVETFLVVDGEPAGPRIRVQDGDPDQLNYLAGRSMGEINRIACEATAAAHAAGGVPNWTFHLDRLDAESLGMMIYTFEHAVAVIGYLLGVDPFDQPGVEAYKSRMFERLGRP